MAFRTTGISPAVIYQTGRGPGLAFERGLGKLFEGIRDHIVLKRKLDDEQKKEEDAINIFRAARQGDINRLFDTITDDDNAGLALNLANVLTTKNQIDAQAELRRAKAERARKDRANEETFFADHGHDLLGAVQQSLVVSPEVTVEETVPVLDERGQPVLVDGKPQFTTRSRKISDAITEPNPLFGVVQELKRKGTKLTPEVVKMILKENERVQKAAAQMARERGLNARAAEVSRRSGQRAVAGAAGRAQEQSGRIELEGVRQENRRDLEQLRQGNRIEVVNARAKSQSSQIEQRIAGQKSIEEQRAALRRELAQAEAQLRRDLAAAKADETKARLVDINDRVMVRFIQKLQETKLDLGEKVPGLKPAAAYWQVLGALSLEAVESFAVRRKDESAVYTWIVKRLMGGDPLGTPPSDTDVERIAEALKKDHGITVSVQGFKRFLADVTAELNK